MVMVSWLYTCVKRMQWCTLNMYHKHGVCHCTSGKLFEKMKQQISHSFKDLVLFSRVPLPGPQQLGVQPWHGHACCKGNASFQTRHAWESRGRPPVPCLQAHLRKASQGPSPASETPEGVSF